jgi:hypothetical protein
MFCVLILRNKFTSLSLFSPNNINNSRTVTSQKFVTKNCQQATRFSWKTKTYRIDKALVKLQSKNFSKICQKALVRYLLFEDILVDVQYVLVFAKLHKLLTQLDRLTPK